MKHKVWWNENFYEKHVVVKHKLWQTTNCHKTPIVKKYKFRQNSNNTKKLEETETLTKLKYWQQSCGDTILCCDKT